MTHQKVFVNYIGRTGGGSSYAFEMTKGLIQNGAKVTAIIPEGISNLQKWRELDFEKLIVIKAYNDIKTFFTATLRFLFFEQWKLRKDLGVERFDFCYIPMIQPWTFLINKLVRGTKMIATLHDPIPHSGSYKLVEYFIVNKWVAAKADKLVILSGKFLNEVCTLYRKKPEQILVIPHGIFDYSQYDKGLVINRFSSYNFLFFGRIERYKGVHILLEAYNRLERERGDISLYIVGKGNIEEYQEEIEKGKNITTVNRFIDDSEVSAYFRGKNIITVLPYVDASQSGVAPIAMKEKSLLIVTNTGGLIEQTNNGRYALICEPNVESVYRKMKYATENYWKCQKILFSAKEYADGLSWNVLAKQVLDFGGYGE